MQQINLRSMNQCRQQGAALIVSLMMLLVLAIIGISGLSNTSLEERMAQNFEHSNVVFQAAESGIAKVLLISNRGNGIAADFPFYSQASDPLIIAYAAGAGDTSTVEAYDMDPGHTLGGASLSASVTVSYTHPVTCTDLSLGAGGFTCDGFELKSTANLDATNAHQVHVQGLARPEANGGAS